MKGKIKEITGKLIIGMTVWIAIISSHGSCAVLLGKAYRVLLFFVGMSYFPIISRREHCEKYKSTIIPIITGRVGFAINYREFPQIDKTTVKRRELPDIEFACYNDVYITGDSDVIVDKNNGCIIYDLCYNRDPNVISVDGLLYRDKNNVGVLRTNFYGNVVSIKDGVMISGKFSYNYFHVIYENLIRLLVINESQELPENVPLLVDASISRISSFNEIFNILRKNIKREVFFIEPRVIYKVSTLWHISPVNKLVPHLSNPGLRGDYFLYDCKFMKRLRDMFLESISNIATPKRIFLSRKHTRQRKFNEEELFEKLVPLGFQKVYPENYSFSEQVALYHNADVIIGGTGAAFSNIICCAPKCKIVCFRSSTIGEEQPIFSSIANVADADFWYYKPIPSTKKESVHANYKIDTMNFVEDLSALI